jgi:hypothetical protein
VERGSVRAEDADGYADMRFETGGRKGIGFGSASEISEILRGR